MRPLSLAVFAALVAAAPLTAAPRPDDRPEGPALVAQMTSWKNFVGIVSKCVRQFGGKSFFESFEREALHEIEPKNLPWLDSDKPFGAYGIEKDVKKSHLVLMIPSADPKEFIGAMEQMFHFKIAPLEKSGWHSVLIEADFPVPVLLTFQEGYACFVLNSEKPLAKVISPKEIINPKETAPLLITARFDRVPVEARKETVDLLRTQLDQLKLFFAEHSPEFEPVIERASNLGLRYAKHLLEEGRELTLRVDVDYKTGELVFDLTFDAAAKSPLAGDIADIKPRPHAFGSLLKSEAIGRIAISKPPFFRETWDIAAVFAADVGGKAALDALVRKGEDQTVLAASEKFFKTLGEWLKTSELEIAAVVRGPDKAGLYTAIGAIQWDDAAAMRKVIEDLLAAKITDKDFRALFNFDVAKIGDVSVHTIDLPPPALETLGLALGKTAKLHFAFGKNAAYAAIGPDALKGIEEAMQAKPAILDRVAFMEGKGKESAAFLDKFIPRASRGEIKMFDRLAGQEKISLFSLEATGGERFKMRFGLGIAAIIAPQAADDERRARPESPREVTVTSRAAGR